MQTDREAIEENYRSQLHALVDKDFTTLDGLLTAGFTRTHINGHTQTKQEWINQLKHDQLVYHSFEFHDTKIKIDGTTASLSGRVTSDATLYGEHRVWQLHIRQTFLKSGGRWQASRSIVTQW